MTNPKIGGSRAPTRYGRRPLPPEFADLGREWDELTKIKPADFVKGGVEVVEADVP